MGLIRAGITAVSSTLADQWKEFFYCESIPNDVLVIKGEKRVGKKSSNKKGTDNVISNGSGIAVADGQCMIIVEQGKVVELCAEPGQFTWDTSTEPSIFAGSLGQSIIDTFKTIGRRFAMGGDAGKDQRVYYFNIKEILDNKFGTPNPIPFRVVDRNIGLDIDVSVRCSGVYSYKITNPMLFYTNVCANVSYAYTRGEIETQLKTEFVSALQPAFARISEMQVRPNALPAHAEELAALMNDALDAKWKETRGIEVISIALNPITLPEEDAQMIKQLQRSAVMRDPTMAAATLVEAQGEAMKSAAKNSGGAMQGFFGMGMAMNQGGMNSQDLYAMGAQQQKQRAEAEEAARAAAVKSDIWKCSCGAENSGKFCNDCGAAKPTVQKADTWKCSCGAENSGKFCVNCGKQKPAGAWKCACGAENSGNFCPSCGARKPVERKIFRCDKCGYTPADQSAPPKFCPECGDLFDSNDVK